MGRHRIGRVSDDPSKNRALAEAVLKKYVEELKTHGNEWAKKYIEGINKFINDPDRLQSAVDKLSTWYNKLPTWYNVRDEYKGEIKKAYNKTMEDHVEALARRYRERIEKLKAEAEKNEAENKIVL